MERIVDYVENFSWEGAPLSDVKWPLVTGAVYVVLVLLTKAVVTTPLNKTLMGHVQAYHNLFLAFVSAIMAVGAAWCMYTRYIAEGSFTWYFCERPSTMPVGPLFFWSYIYYLSKYYELLDTFITLLKGRTPPHFFLHVYHHALVLLMAWLWLETVQTLQFGGLVFNTSVHVVMYYYFYLRARGIIPWWKHNVTRFQIVQFMFSAVCFAITMSYVLTGSDCAGMTAGYFNFAFNMTLLYGFIGVFFTPVNAKQA